MEIIYNENPLKTQVFINEQEIRWLRTRVYVDKLEDTIARAKYLIQKNDIDGAIEEVKLFRYDDEISDWLDKEVDSYIKDLQDEHCGDCTCIPCTCCKCLAEDFLGINTIPCLGKHRASIINGAYEHTDGRIDSALEYLRTFDHDVYWNEVSEIWKGCKEDYDSHVPRWKVEHQQAYDWLLKYKQDHFS